MEFSSTYKKKSPRAPRNRKHGLDKKKKIALIVLAAVLVVAAVVTTVLVVRHNRAADPAAGAQIETQTQAVTTTAPVTQAPTTQAPATQAQAAGDVTITDMQTTMYSTVVTLNVRATPSADGQRLGAVGQDTPLSVTGRCSNGWYRIDYDGGVGYVSGEYVAEAPGGKQNDDAPYLIRVNRQQNIVTVYSKDANGDYTVPYKAMACSVGLDGKTPTGTTTRPINTPGGCFRAMCTGSMPHASQGTFCSTPSRISQRTRATLNMKNSTSWGRPLRSAASV